RFYVFTFPLPPPSSTSPLSLHDALPICSIISAARTAASAALAADWLNGRSRRAESLGIVGTGYIAHYIYDFLVDTGWAIKDVRRSEEHTSELQSRFDLVCRLLLEKKNYE